MSQGSDSTGAAKNYSMGNVGDGARIVQGDNNTWSEGLRIQPGGAQLARELAVLHSMGSKRILLLILMIASWLLIRLRRWQMLCRRLRSRPISCARLCGTLSNSSVRRLAGFGTAFRPSWRASRAARF